MEAYAAVCEAQHTNGQTTTFVVQPFEEVNGKARHNLETILSFISSVIV